MAVVEALHTVVTKVSQEEGRLLMSIMALSSSSNVVPCDVVVKIFGHKRKPEGGEQIGAVQRMHTIGIGRLTWEEVPRCKVLPSLVYKRKEGRATCKGVARLCPKGVYQFWV